MKEEDIIHENGDYWVGREKGSYNVYKNLNTHAESLASYTKDESGLSLAVAYCDYLAKFGMNKSASEDRGWVFVPKEATKEMIKAGENWSGLPSATWTDMLDAVEDPDEDQMASFVQEAYDQGFRDGLPSLENHTDKIASVLEAFYSRIEGNPSSDDFMRMAQAIIYSLRGE